MAGPMTLEPAGEDDGIDLQLLHLLSPPPVKRAPDGPEGRGDQLERRTCLTAAQTVSPKSKLLSERSPEMGMSEGDVAARVLHEGHDEAQRQAQPLLHLVGLGALGDLEVAPSISFSPVRRSRSMR